MKKVIFTLIIFVCIVNLPAQDLDEEASVGIVYGEQHAFVVKAPSGWVLDNSSGVNQGLHAVFYPKGGSWENSTTVMYANGIDIDSTETLEDFIQGDIESFKQRYAGIQNDSLDEISIGNGARIATVVKFYGGEYANFEAVAFIKEELNISTFVYSSRSDVEFNKYFDKFEELVKNYRYIGSKVEIN